MVREMLFNIEDKLKNSVAQYSTFVCVFMNKELWELQTLSPVCVEVRSKLL